MLTEKINKFIHALMVLVLILIGTKILTSCSTKQVIKEPIPIESTQKVDLYEVTKFINFNQYEKDEMELVKPELNRIVASQCFKDEILSSEKLYKTNDLTREQIVKKFRTSKVKIELQMYYSLKGVIGYTYPSSNRIWFNRRFHKKMNVCDETSNLLHELAHKLGFKHSMKRTAQRPFSVPYKMNSVVEKCCKTDYKYDI